MTVTIKKIGGSVAVLIPKSLAREMELTEGSALDISNTGESIAMRNRLGVVRVGRARRS